MRFICQLLIIYSYIVFARILLSWFPMQPGGVGAQLYSAVYTVTEPVLGPIRRAVPAVRIGAMGLDLSPMIVFFGVQILCSIIT